MKSVAVWKNSDGTWSARIFDHVETFRTEDAARAWLRNQGESA